MERIEHWFVRINGWVLIILLAAMSILIFTNVSLRYLTNATIIWADEVARYMMIWMTFLGSGMVLRTGGHVAITNLHDMSTPPVQRVLRLIVTLLMLAFFLMFIWKGIEYALLMQRQLTPATRISFTWIYAAMPAGFLLMAIHLGLVVRSYFIENRFRSLDELGINSDISID